MKEIEGETWGQGQEGRNEGHNQFKAEFHSQKSETGDINDV
jgi:hypothetical protein